jgi:hypothetical protein
MNLASVSRGSRLLMFVHAGRVAELFVLEALVRIGAKRKLEPSDGSDGDEKEMVSEFHTW